jgi:EAL and modified HD-GYP domain-containing signal transduction protein
VAQALTLLGQRQVQRWLALLLFAGGDQASFGSALLETAALRGRLMELLVADDDGPATQDLRDRAFLAGMLSLADVLLGRPLEELAQELHVHEDIRAALQREPGGLGDLLALAERLERADFAGVEELMLRAGVDVSRLPRAQADSRQWVTALMAG